MSRLETGRVNPTLSTLEKVAKALEVSLLELFSF
jgi:transcriptional regulator with XRE-family HTH domain